MTNFWIIVVFSFSYMSRNGDPAGRPCEMSYGGYSSGVHLFPFRTESLSPLAQMVLQFLWKSMSLPIFFKTQVQSWVFFCLKCKACTAAFFFNFTPNFYLYNAPPNP